MQFLADESCDFGVVRSLRAAGHDVLAIAEVSPRAEDEQVIDRAVREGRILITEDKHFGRLFYAQGEHAAGVLLLRFPATARSHLAGTVVELAKDQEKLMGRFVVVQPGRIRIRGTVR